MQCEEEEEKEDALQLMITSRRLPIITYTCNIVYNFDILRQTELSGLFNAREAACDVPVQTIEEKQGEINLNVQHFVE